MTMVPQLGKQSTKWIYCNVQDARLQKCHCCPT